MNGCFILNAVIKEIGVGMLFVDKSRYSLLVCLIVLAAPNFGHATQTVLPEEICNLVYSQLNTVPHHDLNKLADTFTDNGNTYSGCVVRLNSDRTKIKGIHYPGPLFYPFEASALHQQGWRADREADGPDGTSFRISKQNVFCLIEGRWDGGDDSDPKYVPSTHLEVVASCSFQKR